MEFTDLCKSMNIVNTLPEYTKPKNVGLMFFNLEPERFFPCAQIDVVEFPDDTGDQIREKIFRDPIHHQLRDALQYIQNPSLLVPKLNLIKQLGSLTADEIDLNLISKLAAKFSVSKEVISRRLLDIGKISKSRYSALTDAIRISFENEREATRISRKNSGVKIPRNVAREAIDQNSPSLCRTFYNGFREG